MTRSIEHGKRTGFASLGKGGLNFDSFPMRLFAKATPGTGIPPTST